MTPEIAAEASVWVARLHGPDRSVRMERECLAWQERSAAHRLAFERCTEIWQEVAGVTLSSYARSASGEGASVARQAHLASRPVPWALALSVSFLVGLVILHPWRNVESFRTGVGEQQVVMLEDGTRMSLNTATRVRVELGRAQRTVSVEGGEALFEVAKDVSRPFIVQAAGTEVVATGTAFVVRLTPGDSPAAAAALAVTLVEGQVVVRDASSVDAGAARRSPVVMAPGERMRLDSRTGAGESGKQGSSLALAVAQVDRPRMEQVLAWKRGEALFDDVSLLDAVVEMNRYSAVPIRLAESGGLDELRVSGLFQTGDNANFARAVAALHGLDLQESSEHLTLATRQTRAR
ncbi:iron dicitrate transport regulator FecR [Paucibacter sp. KBW04]|nr:iron dicitrate transport regulator FecR [Paucibacter sp. KBW04]